MRRTIFLIILTTFCALSSCNYAYAQTADCPSPNGCALVTREAMQKSLADAALVDAQKKELAVKDQAFKDLTDVLNKMRIDFANVSGEATALKQNAVSDRAIIELLLKNTRKKCMPLSVCF